MASVLAAAFNFARHWPPDRPMSFGHIHYASIPIAPDKQIQAPVNPTGPGTAPLLFPKEPLEELTKLAETHVFVQRGTQPGPSECTLIVKNAQIGASNSMDGVAAIGIYLALRV